MKLLVLCHSSNEGGPKPAKPRLTRSQRRRQPGIDITVAAGSGLNDPRVED